MRIQRLQDVVLTKWNSFTIWNAGKQGRKLFNSLKPEFQGKVTALCDVDLNKIGKHYTPYDPKRRKEGRAIPILNYKDAVPPFVICIKLDLTDGVFEANLNTLNLREGYDYILFS